MEQGDSFTYCAWDGTALKVGTSRSHPQRRLEQLQTGNPNELRLVAWTMALSERQVHRALRRWHIRGEWHRPAPEVVWLLETFDWVDEGALEEVRATCHP
jgi:hypothetical protein